MLEKFFLILHENFIKILHVDVGKFCQKIPCCMEIFREFFMHMSEIAVF